MNTPGSGNSRSAPAAGLRHEQAQLFAIEPPPPDPYRKAVPAVHAIPNGSMTLLQRKLQNAFLKYAVKVPRDSDGFWSMTSARLRQEIDYNSNNSAHLRSACHGLLALTFDFDVLAGDRRTTLWDIGNLFTRILMRRDGVIRFKINDDIVDHLVNPSVFAMIDMAIVRSFRGSVSCALYEFVARYEGIGHTASVDFDTLVGLLQGRSKRVTASEPKHFFYRRLRPALEEVNAISGFDVSLHRSVSGPRGPTYHFKVSRRHRSRESDTIRSLDVLEAVAKLVAHGMHQTSARRLVQTFGSSTCLTGVAQFEARLRDDKAPAVRNSAAFLSALIGNLPPSARLVGKVGRSGPAAPSFDVKGSFLEDRRQKAVLYLRELSSDQASDLARRYNDGAVGPLRIGPKPSRAAAIAFSRWVAQVTWGEPTSQDLLEHATALLSMRGNSA